MSKEATQSVELPAHVVSRVEHRLPHTEFDDAGAYVTYVVEETLSHVEETVEDGEFEPVDEDQVESRLRSLGYLNE